MNITKYLKETEPCWPRRPALGPPASWAPILRMAENKPSRWSDQEIHPCGIDAEMQQIDVICDTDSQKGW